MDDPNENIPEDISGDIVLPTNEAATIPDDDQDGAARILRKKRVWVLTKRVDSIRSKGYYNDDELFKTTPSFLGLIKNSLNFPSSPSCAFASSQRVPLTNQRPNQSATLGESQSSAAHRSLNFRHSILCLRYSHLKCTLHHPQQVRVFNNSKLIRNHHH